MKSKTSILLLTASFLLLLPLREASVAQLGTEQDVSGSVYRAVDIPTFGGPASYINPASVSGSPRQINEKGIAVGAAATSPITPTSNEFVCGGPSFIPFVYHAFEWNGALKDLGTLASDENCSVAASINALGVIAGRSEQDGEIDPALQEKQMRTVVWKNSPAQLLAKLRDNRAPGMMLTEEKSKECRIFTMRKSAA